MLLCSEAPELHTHTREEARGAARESVTDACRARCAESRGRGTRSFTLLDPRLLVVVWTLESAWRRDREVITRQTGRSSGPAPARAAVGDLGGVALGRGTRRRRCVGPGPAGAACPTPAREPQAAAGAGARGGAGGSAVRDSSRDSVRVGLELRTWDAGRAARDAQRDAGRKSGLPPLLRGTGYRPVTGDSHRHIAYDPHSAQITRAARRSAALAHMPGLADGLSW